MNKIIVNKRNYCLSNEEVILNYKQDVIELNIDGKVVINDFNNNDDVKIKINLEDNSELIYNRFNKNISDNSFEINVNNNNYLEFNQSIFEEEIGKYYLRCNILGNNNKAIVNVYTVSNDKGKIVIEATGDIKKKIKDNDMLENIRILNLNNEENVIIPNLLVSSEEVMVNHNATMSNINEDYLFYLMSKGLSKEKASKLIIDGFIIKNLKISDELKQNIKY
jgi:hypothetical protein